MKRFFNWLFGTARRKQQPPLPRVSPVTDGKGFCECVVRPAIFAGPNFFIHFLTAGNVDKMESIAHRVGVEMADTLRQIEFGENPLRFSFKDLSDALANWSKLPVIAEVKNILRAMDLPGAYEHYLSLNTNGMPALMYRCVLLDDVVMTVCFSTNGALKESEAVEWLRTDPIPGFIVPRLVLTTEEGPRLAFVQKSPYNSGAVALMMDPSQGYDLAHAQRLSTDFIRIASVLYNDISTRPYHLEDYLRLTARLYARAWDTFAIKVFPGHYYNARESIFSMSLALDGLPALQLVFMPHDYDIGNLPPQAVLNEVMAESLGRPYPIDKALTAPQANNEEDRQFDMFHERQALAHVSVVTEIVYNSVMAALKEKEPCESVNLARQFNIHDIYGIFGFTSCDSEFARAVVRGCDAKQRARVNEHASRHVEGFRTMFGENYGAENIDTYVSRAQPPAGVIEAKLRAMLINLRVDQRTAERERPSSVYHHRTTSLERPQFRNDWRNDAPQPDPVMQAVMVSTILQDDCAPARHETPVSESVCRDDTPTTSSSDCGSQTYD